MPSRRIVTSLPSSTSRLARSIVSSDDVRVLVGGTVERRRDHLAALHVALHVGDLFGPLVDEQHHEVHLGVVALDRPDDLLHDRGLADLRRRHDQAALALADRREQVDDPAGEQARVVEELEPELLVREQRREVLEPRAVARGVGRHVVDLVDAQERRVLLVARGRAGLALDEVALAEREAADLRGGDVHVVAAGEVARGAQEAVALVAQVEQTLDVDRLADAARLAVALVGDPVALVGGLVAPPPPPPPPPALRSRPRRRRRRPVRLPSPNEARSSSGSTVGALPPRDRGTRGPRCGGCRRRRGPRCRRRTALAARRRWSSRRWSVAVVVPRRVAAVVSTCAGSDGARPRARRHRRVRPPRPRGRRGRPRTRARRPASSARPGGRVRRPRLGVVAVVGRGLGGLGRLGGLGGLPGAVRGAVGGAVGGGGAVAGRGFEDGVDEVGLAEAGDPLDAHRAGDGVELLAVLAVEHRALELLLGHVVRSLGRGDRGEGPLRNRIGLRYGPWPAKVRVPAR